MEEVLYSLYSIQPILGTMRVIAAENIFWYLSKPISENMPYFLKLLSFQRRVREIMALYHPISQLLVAGYFSRFISL